MGESSKDASTDVDREHGVNPKKTVIRAADLVRDIRSGMTDSELRAKYGLSEQGLRIAFRKLLNQRAELAQQIVNDIRVGTTEFELLEKYHLTCRGLQSILRRLVSKSYLDVDEVFGRARVLHEAVTVENLRQVPRNHSLCPIRVYESGDIRNNGSVRDISDGGIGIKGVHAQLNEIKRFVIRDDELGEFQEFWFQALCRWIHTDSEGSPVGGFEIVHISDGNRQRLLDLIDAISIEVED